LKRENLYRQSLNQNNFSLHFLAKTIRLGTNSLFSPTYNPNTLLAHSKPLKKYAILIRHLGIVPYQTSYQAMQHFTDNRDADTPDELWLVEHPPVYTLGQAGKHEHLLNPGNIPIVQTDRGGQVTYHGPGQLIVYLLMDIKRRNWGVKQLVHALEQAVIDEVFSHQITAHRRDNAPGVYVDDRKIASLGLRIRRGRSYHGLSFNIDMDLTPFQHINPCGYAGLEMTQMRDLGIADSFEQLSAQFLLFLLDSLECVEYDC
jgi:lipoyl(octanoyl) transferase